MTERGSRYTVWSQKTKHANRDGTSRIRVLSDSYAIRHRCPLEMQCALHGARTGLLYQSEGTASISGHTSYRGMRLLKRAELESFEAHPEKWRIRAHKVLGNRLLHIQFPRMNNARPATSIFTHQTEFVEEKMAVRQVPRQAWEQKHMRF